MTNKKMEVFVKDLTSDYSGEMGAPLQSPGSSTSLPLTIAQKVRNENGGQRSGLDKPAS